MTVEQLISIHAPRVGSDAGMRARKLFSTNFNPRSPCGERRVYAEAIAVYGISIHAPRVGSDISVLPGSS